MIDDNLILINPLTAAKRAGLLLKRNLRCRRDWFEQVTKTIGIRADCFLFKLFAAIAVARIGRGLGIVLHGLLCFLRKVRVIR